MSGNKQLPEPMLTSWPSLCCHMASPDHNELNQEVKFNIVRKFLCNALWHLLHLFLDCYMSIGLTMFCTCWLFRLTNGNSWCGVQLKFYGVQNATFDENPHIATVHQPSTMHPVFALTAGPRHSAGKKWAWPASFFSFSFFMFERCQRWHSGRQVLKP